jgi:hypothetical protein
LVEVDDNGVNQEEASKMAADHNMKYFKTSAFSGEGVKELIESTIEQVYQ